ncbi:hypothetical protein H0H92_006340 [Tricholoma furcatifolium]|nr:hypothetical protein H0H92_006340 [Tricholoma furcatifolium]
MTNTRPVRTTANKNSAGIVLASQQTRCSTAEKKADEAKAKEHAAETMATEVAELCQKIKSTAAIEDCILQQDIMAAKNSAHPDRVCATRGQSQKKLVDNRKPSDNHDGQSTGNCVIRNGCAASAREKSSSAKNTLAIAKQPVLFLMELDAEIPEKMDSIPPESVLDTDSDRMAVELAFHNTQDDSDNSDLDYTGEVAVQEPEEEEEDIEDASIDAPVPKKKKVAGINCSLRQVINSTRDRPLTQEINHWQHKRKVVENADSDRSAHAVSNVKRTKKLESEGLRKDWRKQIVAKTFVTSIARYWFRSRVSRHTVLSLTNWYS